MFCAAKAVGIGFDEHGQHVAVIHLTNWRMACFFWHTYYDDCYATVTAVFVVVGLFSFADDRFIVT